MVGSANGLPMPGSAPDAGSPTNFLGSGGQVTTVHQPAQLVMTQRSTPPVRLCQVADRPGLHAIMDHMGNVLQLVQTSLPPTAGIAPPAALWASAAATAPTHTQMLGSLSPMPQEQQLSPYSMTATTAQNSLNAASLGLLQQQEAQTNVQPELSTLSTLGTISSAEYGINPQLTQISPQVGASGESIL